MVYRVNEFRIVDDKEWVEKFDEHTLMLAKYIAGGIDYNTPPIGQACHFDDGLAWKDHESPFQLALLRTIRDMRKEGLVIEPK